jgi:Na+-translocating ferredoxin:NAD+ oxidoreductase RnfC subunit
MAEMLDEVVEEHQSGENEAEAESPALFTATLLRTSCRTCQSCSRLSDMSPRSVRPERLSAVLRAGPLTSARAT